MQKIMRFHNHFESKALFMASVVVLSTQLQVLFYLSYFLRNG